MELFPSLTDFTPRKQLKEYFCALMQTKECKDTTRHRYNCLYRQHIKIFEDMLIDEIKVSDLRMWFSSLKLSPKTKRMALSLLSQIFDEAIYDEAIEKNPCIHVKLPKLIKYEPEPFTQEEMLLLLKNSSGWFKNLLAILFLTGMRIGEALALEWKDIDEFIRVDKTITDGEVDKTKTGNTRYIPVFNDLKPFLKNQIYLTGLQKRVFPNATGAKRLKEPWHRLLKKCNMDHRVLYQTRHTFTINALNSGKFKISQIAKILGHSSTQMIFQKYAKFIKSELENIPKDFSTFGHNLDTKAV